MLLNGTFSGIVDPKDAAESAGLIYVSDEEPGIRRKKAGKGFTYIEPGGRKVEDEATLKRIRKLAIPPAYTNVWICTKANGTFRQPAVTPRTASSTAIMLVFVPFAKARNTITCWNSPKRFRGSVRKSPSTWRYRVFRARRCWRPSWTFSRRRKSASGTTTTPETTRATASRP